MALGFGIAVGHGLTGGECAGAKYIADLRRYFASLPADRFPHIVALAVPLTSEGEPDARFEFGLDALVRGIETMKDS